MARTKKPKPVKCEWSQDAYGVGAAWETQCGHTFEFNVAGPEANGFKFCGYCGGHLVPVRTSASREIVGI